MNRSPSPILPTCFLSESGRIEGIYAGRFVALPYPELEELARQAFPEDGEQRLARLVQCARKPSEKADLHAALDDLAAIMKQRRSLLGEEVVHHQDLVKTSLWGLLNAVAVCERLHLIAAQELYLRRRTGALRQALGHALRLHMLRRYLDRQKWAVMETLFLLSTLAESKRPGLLIAEFAMKYQEEAGELAEAIFKRVEACDNRHAALEEYKAILLEVLDVNLLVSGNWTSLLKLAMNLLVAGDRSSIINEHAIYRVTGEEKRQPAQPPKSLIRWLADYLLATKARGLRKLIIKGGLHTFAFSLLPLVPRLLKSDPYATTRELSMPALRTYLPNGKGVIIDPPAFAVGSRKLAHRGMENALKVDENASSSYAIDQLIIRRIVESIAEQDVSSVKLKDFIQRWTGMEESHWQVAIAVLDRVETNIALLADLTLQAQEEVAEGNYSEEMLNKHVETRRILQEAVQKEVKSQAEYRSFYELLHAYYMHGL